MAQLEEEMEVEEGTHEIMTKDAMISQLMTMIKEYGEVLNREHPMLTNDLKEVLSRIEILYQKAVVSLRYHSLSAPIKLIDRASSPIMLDEEKATLVNGENQTEGKEALLKCTFSDLDIPQIETNLDNIEPTMSIYGAIKSPSAPLFSPAIPTINGMANNGELFETSPERDKDDKKWIFDQLRNKAEDIKQLTADLEKKEKIRNDLESQFVNEINQVNSKPMDNSEVIKSLMEMNKYFQQHGTLESFLSVFYQQSKKAEPKIELSETIEAKQFNSNPKGDDTADDEPSVKMSKKKQSSKKRRYNQIQPNNEFNSSFCDPTSAPLSTLQDDNLKGFWEMAKQFQTPPKVQRENDLASNKPGVSRGQLSIDVKGLKFNPEVEDVITAAAISLAGNIPPGESTSSSPMVVPSMGISSSSSPSAISPVNFGETHEAEMVEQSSDKNESQKVRRSKRIRRPCRRLISEEEVAKNDQKITGILTLIREVHSKEMTSSASSSCETELIDESPKKTIVQEETVTSPEVIQPNGVAIDRTNEPTESFVFPVEDILRPISPPETPKARISGKMTRNLRASTSFAKENVVESPSKWIDREIVRTSSPSPPSKPPAAPLPPPVSLPSLMKTMSEIWSYNFQPSLLGCQDNIPWFATKQSLLEMEEEDFDELETSKETNGDNSPIKSQKSTSELNSNSFANCEKKKATH